jgi:PQQ-dependent dehydrogenase (methanol/ethanol family)
MHSGERALPIKVTGLPQIRRGHELTINSIVFGKTAPAMRCKSRISYAVALALLVACRIAHTAESDTAAEWSLLGRTPEMQHYSPLEKINQGNVRGLGLKWFADIDTKGGLLGNPLIAHGVVYQSGAGARVWAHDVHTGRLLWKFEPDFKFDGSLLVGLGALANRGLALWEDYLYVGTADCRLLAIDRRSGKQVWQTQACEAGLTISGAPRVGGGKVFIGNANGDMAPSRGFLSAFDARTGKPLWRFYTIPGDPAKGFGDKAMAMAAKTWGHEWWKNVSGGSVWDAITYDPKLNLVYFGTDGAQPMNPLKRGSGRGDELFTNSIVAVNADTGAYVWHYQTTPNDAWDFNSTMHIMIAELELQGAMRRVVMTAPKNGFFYVLDAHSGKLLAAKNYVPVNWASHIDLKTGRPVELPQARYYEHPGEEIVLSPGVVGAHNWQAMSYSPKTQLVYIPASLLPSKVQVSKEAAALGGEVRADWFWALKDPAFAGKAGRLIAWNPAAGTAKWTADLAVNINGGILSTGGNLVFEGTGDGYFKAYNAANGEQLWSFDTGSSIQAAPSTVEIDGEQLILLPVGIGGAMAKMAPGFLGQRANGPSRLLAFSVGANGLLPAREAEAPFPKPPRPRPTAAALIEQGRDLFTNAGCAECHGPDAKRQVGQSQVADLRRASAETHDQFFAIVLGGSRREKGMPVFAGALSGEDARTIQSFILNQAWDAYEQQTKSNSKQ